MVMFITVVPNRKSNPTILLRETRRENGKVRNHTLANLTHWAPEKIAALSAALEAARSGAPAGVQIVGSLPHGDVHAVLGTMRRLGLEQMLLSRRCRERDLVMAMIVARVLDPASKLSTARSFRSTTLGEALDVAAAKPDELYQALDWLLERQEAIENKLAKRHLTEGSLLLYDLTTVWFEGRACPLGKFGHSKEGRSDKLQILVGLLCNREGVPISAQVFEGNASETGTLAQQIQAVRERFGLTKVVFIADRGILRSVRIKDELAPIGLDWITALRKPAIRELIQKGAFQPSLFEEVDFAEIEDPAYPGERLIVCRNPVLADDRARRREELIQRTEKDLQTISNAVHRERNPLRGEDKIGLKVGAVLANWGTARFFDILITDKHLGFHRKLDFIKDDTALDGFYILRTSLTREAMDTPDAIRAYKDLAKVETAFKQLKTEDLEIRPIYHHLEGRVRAHVFLCMLAFYVEWHLRKALAPLLFGEEDPAGAEAQRSSPVAKAKPSPSTKAKKGLKQTPDGHPVQSYRDLLQTLATLGRHTCQPDDPKLPAFTRHTKPTPYQQRVFDLLQIQAP